MFGYVTPLKPELKIREYNQFKSYYCGVCFAIKNLYGNIPRMTLNYDMTFLALLLDGLIKEDLNIELKRCIAHPDKKKPVILNNTAINYAASMNVSLVYYKLLDDINDDNSLKSKFSLLFMKPYHKSFPDSIVKINSVIEKNLNKLSSLEKTKDFKFIDEICDPFSIIVGTILKEFPYELKNDSKELREQLYLFGYSLGKWIYLMDALDDLEEDMKNNKFNPINFLYNKDNLPYKEFLDNIKQRLEFSIFNCAYTCKEILDSLPLNRNKEILENIINLGMMDKYIKVTNKCRNKKKGSEKYESI
ncbi:DUF5685 family protein [Clostridium sp.]|uniref:DUF5685 family protein n=1 Tax=Clostridium sp. TaxID=1506 RepID=UPI002A91ED65|nr:DUF5685 family protein [Clostridium sp.]MDY6013022.1 DUF5685 family protein [Clostridium sp.]